MLSDDAFLRAFFSAELAGSDFHHRDHLRLAWLAVRRYGLVEAEAVVAEGIQHFAAVHGHAARYHDTMTRFWVRLVAHAVRTAQRSRTSMPSSLHTTCCSTPRCPSVTGGKRRCSHPKPGRDGENPTWSRSPSESLSHRPAPRTIRLVRGRGTARKAARR